MTSRTTCPKLTQNRHCLDRKARNRPTSILFVESWHEILPKSHRGRIQAISMGYIKKCTTWTRKSWTHIQKRSQPGSWSSVQQTSHPEVIHGQRGESRCNGGPRGHQRQAARPKRMSVEETARSTNLLMRLEPPTRSWWPGGATPRPAGLGEAARPHFSASDDAFSHGVEAKEEVA